MPTYQNVNSINQVLNGKIVEPGKEVCSLSYYDENAIKLLQVNDKPFWNSTVLSEKITTNQILSIPKEDSNRIPISKFSIHFCVAEGEVEIFYNDINNLPSLKLYPNCKWNIRVFERYINKVVIKGLTEKFVLFVIIEKLP